MYERISEALELGRSQLLDLQDEEAVVRVRVTSRAMTGRPYAAIVVRMNEYGTVTADRETDDDPVGNLLNELDLTVVELDPTTKSTSQVAITVTDPNDREVDQ